MIWVIAGTLDGRTLAVDIQERTGEDVLVTVVSQYGAELAAHKGITVHTGRLDQQAMQNLIKEHNVRLLIDASHPYAAVVTATAQDAAKAVGIPFVRFERKEVPLPEYDKLHIVVDEVEAANLAGKLAKENNNHVYLTTGSKTMHIFAKSEALQDCEVWTRILPTAEVLQMMEDLNVSPKRIVAVQGPFSYDMNRIMFHDTKASVVVMKNSGLVGGADTKLQAAMDLGIHVIVLIDPVLNLKVTWYQRMMNFSNYGRTLMDYVKNPKEIEDKSMQIIYDYVKDLGLTDDEVRVVSRTVHASGDVEYAQLVKMSPDAVQKGIEALENGANIYTDVEMVRTGISKPALKIRGNEVHCLIKDENVAKMAKELGVTRSIAAMRTFGKQLEGQIVAIGNAPTALYEVLRLALEEGIKPALIIGIPVGFVGAAESKDYLMEVSPVPYITVKGNKGGSPIAASVCNALLYTDVKRNDMLFVEGKESK